MGNYYQPVRQDEPRYPPMLKKWMIPVIVKIDKKAYNVSTDWLIDKDSNNSLILIVNNEEKYLIEYLFEYKKKKYALVEDNTLWKLDKNNNELMNDKFLISSVTIYE